MDGGGKIAAPGYVDMQFNGGWNQDLTKIEPEQVVAQDGEYNIARLIRMLAPALND